MGIWMWCFRKQMAGAVLALLMLSTSSSAQSLTSADPAGAGFSAARLARIAPWYQSKIDTGALPGAVVAIVRNGKLAYEQAIGTYDRAGKIPLKPDAIFWIASMTKPVTSVAAMMLVEEGKLELNAPVAKYLPELADMKVGTERVDPGTGKHSVTVEPPKRPMQIIDLLRHTSGLTYPEEGNDGLHRVYNLADFGRDRTLAQFVKSLGWIPLVHQPGEVWEYSWGVDVLARVIEVVSGQSFDKFLEDRIFKPLHMVDTGFFVPAEKLGRLADPIAGGRPATWDITKPAKLFSGGGGLVSTAPDYLRFAQMLLNGGELNGARILNARTVQQMTTNALPSDVSFAGEVGKYVGPRVGTSWGLGFAVRTNPESSLLPGAVGSFNWSGLWGTWFWIDPGAKLAAVLMIQVPPDSSGPYREALRHLTYAALSVPQPSEPTTAPASVGADVLESYVGTYDFGRSLSALDKQVPLTFVGVGLEIEIVDGKAAVLSAMAGGPAVRAGVKVGDVVTEIDAAPVQGLGIDPVIAKLRGAAGAPVRLKLVRKDQDKPIDITIVRELIRQAGARIEVRVVDGALAITAVGPWAVLDFEKGKPTAVKVVSTSAFCVEGGDRTRLTFETDSTGKTIGVVLDPGPFEIRAAKIN